MNAVGSSSITIVCSLSGHAWKNCPVRPVTDACPPGAKIPPSLQ